VGLQKIRLGVLFKRVDQVAHYAARSRGHPIGSHATATCVCRGQKRRNPGPHTLDIPADEHADRDIIQNLTARLSPGKLQKMAKPEHGRGGGRLRAVRCGRDFRLCEWRKEERRKRKSKDEGQNR
jgi:hypothetical protein